MSESRQVSEPNKLQEKQPKRKHLWGRIAAVLLGATLGATAITADQEITDGLFAFHLNSSITNPVYRQKVLESAESGEIAGDIKDLFREAENKASDAGSENETGETSYSILLGDQLRIIDPVLSQYFPDSQIRGIKKNSDTPYPPIFIATIDNPAITDFNVGDDQNIYFDPWMTQDEIGPFITLPTHQATVDNSIREHALYAGYIVDGEIIEYPDLDLEKNDRDPYLVRAGALVLFTQNGISTLVAMDSRDINFKIGDNTPHGQVTAIESFAASISSQHEKKDLEDLNKLKGVSGLSELFRRNYNSVVVTYTLADGSIKTIVMGLYTNAENTPDDVNLWTIDEQLSPQHFYDLSTQYAQELDAVSWTMIIPDPGPSANLYDAEHVIGEVTTSSHSEFNLRPRYSLVQLGR